VPAAEGQGGTDRVRRRVIVSGRVQGVFFRASLSERAGELGVGGWARNRDDGTVEACFEGPPDAVERIVAYAREGPRAAQVSGVDVFEEEPEGLEGFGTG
jgi:acylphosphatase